MRDPCPFAPMETLALVIVHAQAQAQDQEMTPQAPVCWALPGPCVSEIAACQRARAVLLHTPAGPVPIHAPAGLSLRSVCATQVLPLPGEVRPGRPSGPRPGHVVFAASPDEPHLLVLDPASLEACPQGPCELPALRA